MEPAVADQSQVLMEIDTSGQIRIPIDSKEVAHELMHQRVLAFIPYLHIPECAACRRPHTGSGPQTRSNRPTLGWEENEKEVSRGRGVSTENVRSLRGEPLVSSVALRGGAG